MAGESKRGRASGAKPGTKRTEGRTAKRDGIAEMLSMDSERSARILLFGAVGAVLAIAAGFMAFGYWYAEIRPEGRTVLEADGIKVSFAAMKRRMTYELSINPQYIDAPQALPEAAYLATLNELTLISRANELGVSATPEEIDSRVRARMAAQGLDQRQFADKFRDALEKSGLNESEYRRVAEAEVLAQKIEDKFTSEAPPAVEQAQIQVISAADLETAQQARDRILAGEAWEVVARELSADPNVQETGGLLPYQFDGALSPAFNDFAFQSEPGALSEPLSTTEGIAPYYIVRVVDRSEQPLTQEQMPTFVGKQYDQWAADTQAKMTIERNWDVADQAEALSEIDLTPEDVLPINPTNPPVEPTAAATSAAAEPTAAGAGDSAPNPSGAPQPDGQ